MLLFTCSKILRRYIYNTVCINIECNFNLRYSTWSRRDSIQSELSEWFIILGELSLTLYYVDIYSCLVICCRREDLALLCRNCCISLDQSCSHTTHCLDRQWQWSYIKKKDIACTCISCKFTSLYGSTKCYTLIRAQRFAWLFACQSLHFFLNCRDTCWSTNKKYLTKLGSCDTCIRKCTSYRLLCLLYKISCQFIKFSSCKVHIEMLRSFSCCCDERKVDIGCRCTWKFFFSFLCCFS